MKAQRDGMLLRRFQLCRADIVATLGESALPPSPQSLRMLADLQLSIMAVEAAIGDKSDSTFRYELLMEAAA
jgi:hypothetical protein